MSTDQNPTRADARYEFAIPVVLELSRGLLRPADRVTGVLLDLSKGGAAITTRFDPRLRLKKRYRVIVDDHVGIIAVKNIVPAEGEGETVRLGVRFESLGLELQEIVSDVLQEAQWVTSRLDQSRSIQVEDLTSGR